METNRRDFLKNASLSLAALSLSSADARLRPDVGALMARVFLVFAWLVLVMGNMSRDRLKLT